MNGRSKRNGALAVLPALFLAAGCMTSGSALERAGLKSLSQGILAGEVASGLNDQELRKALEAENQALTSGATGASVNWEGREGTLGIVTPGQPYRVGTRMCRRYSHTITVEGNTRTATGTACRNEDEAWQPLA